MKHYKGNIFEVKVYFLKIRKSQSISGGQESTVRNSKSPASVSCWSGWSELKAHIFEAFLFSAGLERDLTCRTELNSNLGGVS